MAILLEYDFHLELLKFYLKRQIATLLEMMLAQLKPIVQPEENRSQGIDVITKDFNSSTFQIARLVLHETHANSFLLFVALGFRFSCFIRH